MFQASNAFDWLTARKCTESQPDRQQDWRKYRTRKAHIMSQPQQIAKGEHYVSELRATSSNHPWHYPPWCCSRTDIWGQCSRSGRRLAWSTSGAKTPWKFPWSSTGFEGWLSGVLSAECFGELVWFNRISHVLSHASQIRRLQQSSLKRYEEELKVVEERTIWNSAMVQHAKPHPKAICSRKDTLHVEPHLQLDCLVWTISVMKEQKVRNFWQ